MKQNILIVFLITAVLVIMGFVVYIAWKLNNEPVALYVPPVVDRPVQRQKGTQKETRVDSADIQPEIRESVPQQEQNALHKDPELVSIDTNWNRYTNHTLGFSMEVPKKNYAQYGFEKKKNLMEKCLLDNNVVVIADEATGRVYIGSKNIYSDEEECYAFDFNVFDTKLKGCVPCITGGVILSVYELENSPEALNALLGSRRGYSYCKSNGKKLNDGKINIVDHIIMEGDYLHNDGCFINWASFTYYSIEKKKLAFCDLGQNIRFLDKNKDESVQNRMFDSFKFE